MSRHCALIALLCAMLVPGGASAAERVAVFDFELIDTSLDGEMLGANAAEQARLAGMAPRLRAWFGKEGRFEVADMGSVVAEAKASNLQACGGCVAKLAHRVGATLAITGTVQKVSNLILNVNLYLTDVDSKKAIAAMSTDIRSNSDESWHRGLDWLIAHRLPAALAKAAP
ncbi:MAG: DUF3280 domain-containing protein [Parvibaculaceae bacterium]